MVDAAPCFLVKHANFWTGVLHMRGTRVLHPFECDLLPLIVPT